MDIFFTYILKHDRIHKLSKEEKSNLKPILRSTWKTNFFSLHLYPFKWIGDFRRTIATECCVRLITDHWSHNTPHIINEFHCRSDKQTSWTKSKMIFLVMTGLMKRIRRYRLKGLPIDLLFCVIWLPICLIKI